MMRAATALGFAAMVLVTATAVAGDPPTAAGKPQAPPPAAAPAARWDPARNVWFRRTWGIEIVGVKPLASGYMLAFRYRVVDPAKAALLNDRHNRAYLVDNATGTVLAVPTLENVGELRQASTPEPERTYFMMFGNPGQLVKRGSSVSVVAGSFRADGLIVQ
jgi:hypothetical protein